LPDQLERFESLTNRFARLADLLAHEYASDKMLEIHATVASMSSTLLATVPRVMSYADAIIQRYPK
jgi:hypothetical protein